MYDLEERLAQLQRGAKSAAFNRARAIAEQEAAKVKVTEAARELQQRFGVSSVAQAQALLDDLSRQADDKLNEAKRFLESVENG